MPPRSCERILAPVPGGTGTLLSPNEPELIRRERSALGEILRLVAERADAEAKVEARTGLV